MNCQEFESNVVRLARTQMADAGNRQQSLAHAETCLRCAERLAEAQTLIAGIRAVMVEISDSEAPPHVESALLTTFRAQARRKNASVVAFASAREESPDLHPNPQLSHDFRALQRTEGNACVCFIQCMYVGGVSLQ